MKSLQESLFDKDLVEKGVSINFEALCDMLFDFGRRKASMFDKTGVIYHEGRQSIHIKKFLGEDDRLCVELDFGIIKVYPDSAAFNIPTMMVHDRWMGGMTWNSWKSSQTDMYTTRRKIDDIIKLENNNKHLSTIESTSNNIGKLFDLYERMIEQFCSKKFEKDLIKYMTRYESKKEIPGIVLDILMKKLIKGA